MTPARLRQCLDTLRWSQRGLGEALGIDDRQVRRWTSGAYSVPTEVASWLERLAAAHAQHPPPVRRKAEAA